MRALLICNPNSTAQTPLLFEQIVPVLRATKDIELRTVFTHYPGHAHEMCQVIAHSVETSSVHAASRTLEEIAEFDPEVIIAVGGDGTVNEIINGLLGKVSDSRPPRLPALAVIPTGSANVFARALGFPGEPIYASEVLRDTLERGQTRAIALGTWQDSWFAVNAGFGIDADVIARVEKARNKGFAATPLRYLRVALRAWRRTRKYPPHISARAVNSAGQEFIARNIPILIASNTNPWTFLGPLAVVTNPRNSFDLGLGLWGVSDVSGIGGVASMLHLVGLGKSAWARRLVNRRTMSFDDAIEVELTCVANMSFQVDGEYAGKFDQVTLRAVPEALRVYAPEEKVEPTPLSHLRLLLGFFDIRI